MTTRLLVLGTTPYTDAFIDMFETVPGIVFDGCVENLDRAKCKETVAGLPILWNDDLHEWRESHRLICSLATTKRAAWIESKVSQGFLFATLAHPASIVSRRSQLGSGVSIDAGTIIAGYTRIGGWVRVGRQVSIGHHSEIQEFSTIHPGAIISGNCRIGRQVTIGTGAVLIDGVTIGDKAVIAAGAVVRKSVAPSALVAGNPCAVMRQSYGPI
ncbi:hypothetical protein [Mesorhizobium sp. 10J20-29]